MRKKIFAALLSSVMAVSVMTVPVLADGEKTFVHGTTGYGVEMGDEGLNPHLSLIHI